MESNPDFHSIPLGASILHNILQINTWHVKNHALFDVMLNERKKLYFVFFFVVEGMKNITVTAVMWSVSERIIK